MTSAPKDEAQEKVPPEPHKKQVVEGVSSPSDQIQTDSGDSSSDGSEGNDKQTYKHKTPHFSKAELQINSNTVLITPEMTPVQAVSQSLPITPTSLTKEGSSQKLTGSLSQDENGLYVTPIKKPSNVTTSSSECNPTQLLATLADVSTDRKRKKEEERQMVSTPSSTTSDDLKSPDDDSYKRKDKSLSLLCQNFLTTYGNEIKEICLGEASCTLKVERRRIYDIIHVFESLGIMERQGKNRYMWYGLSKLPNAVDQIMNQSQKPETQPSSRKEKSLGTLSLKFVILFLRSQDKVVTLEDASSSLSAITSEEEKKNRHPKQKTKIRRLYDIANVLTALGLIKKTKVMMGNGTAAKSAFEWVGPISADNATVSKPSTPPMTPDNKRKRNADESVSDTPPPKQNKSTRGSNENSEPGLDLLRLASKHIESPRKKLES